MTLRESLIPNPSAERIRFLTERIIEVESSLDNDNVGELIAAFATETGKDGYDFEYFRDFNSFQSAEEFARDAATPVAHKVDDITREELVWIVERIGEADDFTTYYLELLEKNVPDEEVSDLIYWPNLRGFKDLTAEQIVTIALDPEPYRRPPPDEYPMDVRVNPYDSWTTPPDGPTPPPQS